MAGLFGEALGYTARPDLVEGLSSTAHPQMWLGLTQVSKRSPSVFRIASKSKSRLQDTLFWLSIVLASAAGVGAQALPPAHAKIDLVAEDSSLQAGRVAWIGILRPRERLAHLLGESWRCGRPSANPVERPAGLSRRRHSVAGSGPPPHRFLIDYGYEGRVLLAVPLQVPADYKPGTPSALAADVRYVICREVCIPAKAHVTLSIPSGNSAPTEAAARRELFRAARERWPTPPPAGWEIRAIDNGSHLVLSIQTGRREDKASFFPLDQDQIDNAAPQVVAPAERGAQLTLQKSDPLSKPISVLKGIVVLAPDRAFEIAAPVAPRR